MEEFRSVIDDLTIANKRLKQKLKKYEKLYDAHLQDEKLFEVRFHGLPDSKKRELEETLRKFAAELDDGPVTDYPVISSHPAPFDPQKTASSHASRFAESGYASMSASGQNSTSAPSNQTSIPPPNADRDNRRMTKLQYNQQQQSIQSYLHDIPAGLLPKNHVPMTEKTKKKLVVRRLEQIFAGKRSVPGTHPQPMQQEEVAQSAAMADRRAREATGQLFKTEGNREARIMLLRADDEDITMQNAADSLQMLRPTLHVQEHDFAGSGSPDQRPTRPLDLDPYRAQVPAENMEYIRHLGFTPPDMMSGETPQDGHGWLYLNLLVNMAQLHTLNVTPDFVKDAVTEYSSKFELSHDGRKIRWRGSPDITKSNSDSSSEHQGDSPYEIYGNSKSPAKRLKTGTSGSTESNREPEHKMRRTAREKKEQQQNKFIYTPLFFHKEDSDEEGDFYGFDVGSSSNSPYQAMQAADSSGFGSSAMRSSSSKRRRDDGPMIFYSKARFCTDLTGDRNEISNHVSDSYNIITSHPIGVQVPAQTSVHNHTSDIGEPRGPFDSSPMQIDSRGSGQASSSGEDIGFSPDSLKDDNGTESPDAVDFEASGLGGVHPEDNFSIRVRRSQLQITPTETPPVRRRSRLYPKKILEALNERSSPEAEALSPQQHVIKEEILSTSRKSLPSSALPPASFLPFDSTSSGDVDSDLESDVSSGPSSTSSSDKGPATALQLRNISPIRPSGLKGSQKSNRESSEDGEEESDSDDSIDLLATARKVDPSTVFASEREYDASLAERLAEEIPAGSSAATAGGGSGFNSPAGGVANAEEGEQSARNIRVKRHSTTSGSLSSRTKNLKRSRTRESIATALQGNKGSKNQKLE